MICFVRFQFSSILAFTVAAIFISNSIRAVKSSAQCNQSCKGYPNRVPYPFGFSNGCKIPLNCTQNGRIKIGRFEVKNITSDSILVNLPPKCNRTVQQTQQLFGLYYAPTWHNGLLLDNCTTRLNNCLIPTTMVQARFGSSGCGSGSGDLSCYSGTINGSGFIGYHNLTATGCEFLFSSIAVADVSLRFQAVELGWWLDACECVTGAECMNFTVPSGDLGCRCQCKEGLIGDGYTGGSGCRKVPNCSALKFMSGECGGKARVGILIAGIIAGALLMAAVSATCYFIKRRSRSLRNFSSTKRLLCDAAGNSSVPFYPYKEIERATNSFSEKQRLGTGAYGTVYAGKLHNNEWVAIKKIRHRDAEGFEQVMNEIKLLTSVSHPNLVRLLGCCIENDEQILVYEFMPNGTLSQHLQRERSKGLP